MRKKNILILGANSRNALAAAGGLSGGDYHLIGVDERANSKVVQTVMGISPPAAFDKVIYTQKYSHNEIPEFLGELENIIRENRIDVLLPTGTHYTTVVSEFKERLSRLCIVPVDDFEKMNNLHDKFKAMELCKSMGISIPQTFLIEDKKSLEIIKNEISYPAVLKARKGAGNIGVWEVRDDQELEKMYRENIVDKASENKDDEVKSKPIIQEFIPGELHDVTSFSVSGTPKAVLSQVRVMSSPLWGGSGIVNRTTDNQAIKKIASDIIRKVKWDGILEFDFKIDSRDGTAKLIEINPKIWGTTWLTIQAGFNMPLYLVKNALGEPYSVPDKYKVGLCARWPFLEMETWTEQPVSAKIFVERVLRFIKLFEEKNVVYDFRLLGVKACVALVILTALSKIKNVLKMTSRLLKI